MRAGFPGRMSAAPGRAGFQPTRLQGLQLWLDANDKPTIVQSAGAVSQWNDKSGQGNNATQGSASLKPTTDSNTINGKNVLNFDADLLSIAADASINNMFAGGGTVFTVHRSESLGEGSFGRLMEKASGLIYMLADANLGAQTIRILMDFGTTDGDWATRLPGHAERNSGRHQKGPRSWYFHLCRRGRGRPRRGDPGRRARRASPPLRSHEALALHRRRCLAALPSA